MQEPFTWASGMSSIGRSNAHMFMYLHIRRVSLTTLKTLLECVFLLLLVTILDGFVVVRERLEQQRAIDRPRLYPRMPTFGKCYVFVYGQSLKIPSVRIFYDVKFHCYLLVCVYGMKRNASENPTHRTYRSTREGC